MAYIVSTTQTATAAAATYTVTLGAHVSGDLLLVYLSQDGGATAIAPDATSATAGWVMLGTGAANQACRGQWAYLIADSSSEVNPVFTGSNDDWIGTCVVIRDAHATSPFGATPTSGTDFRRSDWGISSSAASNEDGDLTSAVDECLLLYSWTADGSNRYMRCKLADCIEVDKYNTTNINHIVGARQQQTAGVAPTATMYDITSAEGGNGWIIAIRNKTGGALQPDVRVTGTELKWYGAWEVTHDAVTWQAASSFAATINGITCTTAVPTVNYTGSWTDSPWGAYTAIPHGDNLATASIVGGTHTITSTDMTGKVFCAEIASITTSTSTAIATDGHLIGFSDGTNWVVYQIASKTKGWAAASPFKVTIALGQATTYATSGAINWAAVTRIGYFYHRATGVTTSAGTQLKNATLIDLAAITGGGSSRPVTFQDLNTYFNSWSHYQFTQQQASAQILIKTNVQIGDDTNKTYFDGAAQSVEFTQAWSATSVRNWQMNWNVPDNVLSLSVKARDGDTINLASGVAATDTAQNLSINAASAAAADATYNFAQSFVGWRDPIDNKGLTWSNTTFKECGTVTIAGGGDLTNCSISKTTSTTAPLTITANGTTITTSTITVADTSITTAHHIAFGASVTACTLNGVTLSGTPGTDKIYSALASGTLTITADGTGTALVSGDVTFIGGSTAVAVIAAPQVYQSVTVSGFTTGSRIQIYDTTSSTPLFNGTASAGGTVVSGTTATWTDPAAASADRAIRIRVSYVSGATAKQFIETSGLTCGQTSGTKSVTYPVTSSNDTTYNSNAIDGSGVTGITFVDSGSNDRVDCNIAGGSVTYPSIYAAFVYWNFTATGIANDFTYVDAPDTANYLFSGMKIRNTSATDLMVTGGYGRDSTSGLSKDIVDTAGSTGNIFLAPDHVVAYATGSGSLTSGDISNIWSNATRTITGSGVTAQDKTDVAAAVRTNLALELARLLDLAKINGLVPGTDAVVTATTRTAGDVAQSIAESGGTVTVSRA